MAEKYGVVPPKFTKEWWPYFWEYYKVHTIVIAFIIIAVVTTAVQCAGREKYDLNVTYGGKLSFDTELTPKLEEEFEKYIDDVDGNGEKNVFFQAMTISGLQGYEQYDYALETKLQLEFQMENSFIFLLDKTQMDTLMKMDSAGETFTPVSEWADNVDESRLVKADDGKAYAVDISDSKIFADCGLPSEGTYALLKLNLKPEEKAAYESSKKLLREIIK